MERFKLTWLQAHFGGSHPGHFSSGARMFSFGSVNIHPAHDHDLKCDMTQPCDVCWSNCSFRSAFHLALANTGIGSKELRVRPSLHCVLAATTRNSWSTSGTALIDVETASWTWWVFLWKTLELWCPGSFTKASPEKKTCKIHVRKESHFTGNVRHLLESQANEQTKRSRKHGLLVLQGSLHFTLFLKGQHSLKGSCFDWNSAAKLASLQFSSTSFPASPKSFLPVLQASAMQALLQTEFTSWESTRCYVFLQMRCYACTMLYTLRVELVRGFLDWSWNAEFLKCAAQNANSTSVPLQ